MSNKKINILNLISVRISTKNLIIFLAMIVVFLAAYFSSRITFYSPDNTIDKMSIQIQKSELASVPYSLLLFDFHNEIIKLNINMLCDSRQLKLLALTNDKMISSISVSKSAIALKDTYSGSFAAVLPSFDADIDDDGTKEKVNLYAKADTIFTQGWVPVRTDFKDKQIAMEVHNLGGGSVEILYDQKPLKNKEVKLFSNRGLNKTLKTDENGTLLIKDVRDLREGIIVVYEGENNSYNIASYTLESSTLFTKYHLKSLIPLIYILLISSVIIISLTVFRMVFYKNTRKKTQGDYDDILK